MQYHADLINLEVFLFLLKVAGIPMKENTFKMALPLSKCIHKMGVHKKQWVFAQLLQVLT